MTEPKADRPERPNPWPWPHFHHRVAQRDAAVARAEADGQIVTEAAPADVTEEQSAESARLASLPRAGDKLISAAPPLYDPSNDRDPRQDQEATSASPVAEGGTETMPASRTGRGTQKDAADTSAS
jgi:hypothetical protein